MGIERAAQNIENEAITNPKEAAASMKLLDEAQQSKLIDQIQKDAARQDANFSVERDREGHVTAINFAPLAVESGTLWHADANARK